MLKGDVGPIGVEHATGARSGSQWPRAQAHDIEGAQRSIQSRRMGSTRANLSRCGSIPGAVGWQRAGVRFSVHIALEH